MSAGVDSRFVLGLLRSAGVSPRLFHLSGPETDLVEQLASELMTPLVIIDSSTRALPAAAYTLMTDAQIYYRGGQYNKLRAVVERDSLYHTGLFSSSLTKLTFRSAWKIPDPRRTLYERLVDFALLSPIRGDALGLRVDRVPVRRLLLDELEFGNSYEKWKNSKETANWFYYLHRGVRWSQATTSDLSYFTNVVHLLADLDALSWGITSSISANAGKARAKRLTSNLFPDVTTPYDDGPAPQTLVAKFRYEFLSRLAKRRRTHDVALAKKPDYSTAALGQVSDLFGEHFTASLEELTSHRSSYHRNVQRAAITLGYVLAYLDGTIGVVTRAERALA
jgi:hypothetical protein